MDAKLLTGRFFMERMLPETGALVARISAGSDTVMAMLWVLERLAPEERAAFLMRHYHGCSIEEIGSTLGMKTNATKHSIFRAVKKMRVALEPFVES